MTILLDEDKKERSSILFFTTKHMKGQPSRGKLIVIEGGDGSGKTVQSKLLLQKLEAEGQTMLLCDFPRHGHMAGYFVDKMLTGEYGTLEEQDPYRTSLFYALDRFDASFEMNRHLDSGGWIVSNRYVTSNIGHQGGKIKDPVEREKYIAWLFDIEYQMFGIPKPDMVFYLHVPVEVSLELLQKKDERKYLEGGKIDIQESSLQHLKDAQSSYLHCVEQFENWFGIECYEAGILRSPEHIHQEISKLVQTLASKQD